MSTLKNKNDIVGTKIGKLTVVCWLRHETAKTNHKHVYKCLCECGNYTEVKRPNLINHHTVSCGCFRRERIGSKHTKSWTGYEEISGSLWSSILGKAKSRNLEFAITKEDAWQQYLKQNKKCVLTGQEIKFSKFSSKNRNDRTASLDRIDSSKGYTIDNIQWIHKDINILKMNLPEEKFIRLCICVAEFAKGKI